ncbi:hypothetical protein HN371_06040 [Candidatus Poribacteria bacterium]|nr:hypothetical protein [Candidatus Poribacteria bacterium]MBT5533471.1 hypothetical protein [Candidatus Poribacteria bacterium]MBT7098423.1 hypothetical protein [Candidatus Poribacteria bacterium]
MEQRRERPADPAPPSGGGGRRDPIWAMNTAWGESDDGPAGLHSADVPVLRYTPGDAPHASAVQWRRSSEGGDKVMMALGDYDGMNGVVRLFDDETPEAPARPNVGVQLHPKGPSYFVGGNVGIGTTEPTARLDVDSDAIRVRRPRKKGALGPGERGEIVWARDDAGKHYIYVNVDGTQWQGVELTLSEPARP